MFGLECFFVKYPAVVDSPVVCVVTRIAHCLQVLALVHNLLTW